MSGAEVLNGQTKSHSDRNGRVTQRVLVGTTALAAFAGVIGLALFDQNTAITSWSFIFRAVAVFAIAVALEQLVELLLERRHIKRLDRDLEADEVRYQKILQHLDHDIGAPVRNEENRARSVEAQNRAADSTN